MIAAPSAPCLTDQELRDFSSGRLPEPRFESLLSHLDCCERCQYRVESAARDDDSFLGALATRDDDEHDPVLAESDCQAALYHAASRSPKPLDRVLPPIETLGPYRLIRPLGRGGMGAVYLAEHERLRRKFAVKLLPKERGLDADWLERFQRETQAVASLEHPNLITATDAGDVAGWHYLVMEYLDGLDMAAIVRRLGSVSIESATAIMRDVCAALSALHDAGLVHRDVKPSNVMLTRDGKVKLLDLGLVLDGQSAAEMRLTTVGHVLGTLAFAAPEQLSNRAPVDGRADLYGVGGTLFQLITGQPSHELRHGIGPLVIEKTAQPARTMRSILPEVPDELNSLVAELLERDPNNRPDRASDVAKSLAPFASDASLRSLVQRALRADHSDESTSVTPSIVFQGAVPPRNNGRSVLAWSLGGFAAVVLASITFYVQTDRGTLVIESPRDDVRVEILQGDEAVESLNVATGKTQTTLRSGHYTVRLSGPSDGIRLSDDAVAILRGDEIVVTVREENSVAVASADDAFTPRPESTKLYRGEPLSHWLQLVRVERDTQTLGDAMDAIASLADAEDVDAAHTILVTARRFGGWSVDPDTESGKFMGRFRAAFGRMLPSPAIEAIIRELPIGNEQSRSACLRVLTTFDATSGSGSLIQWASDVHNRESAIQLHHAMKQLMTSRELQDERSESSLRNVSLILAIQLDTPLAQEPGLFAHLQELVTNYNDLPGESRAARMELLSEGHEGIFRLRNTERKAKPWFDPSKAIAAFELGIEMDPRLATASLLSTDGTYSNDDRFREQRNALFLKMLETEPVAYADEAILWLATMNPSNVSLFAVTLANSLPRHRELWTAALPKIAQSTSDPDAFIPLLTRDNSDGNTNVVDPEFNVAVQSSIKIATTRRNKLRRSMPAEELRAITLPENVQVIYEAESPDKFKIAFAGRTETNREQSHGLFVFDRITNELTQLIDNALKTRPAWSPDSTRIAIGNAPGYVKQYPLVIVDAESGAVDETNVEGAGATWSPDGRYVAVSTEFKKGGSWLEGVPVDGRIGVWDTQARAMTHVSPAGTNELVSDPKGLVIYGGIKPKFSPDGKWLAWLQVYSLRPSGGEKRESSSVWFAHRDGTGLTQAFENATNFKWSDDSRSLVNPDSDERVEVPSDLEPRSSEIPDTWLHR